MAPTVAVLLLLAGLSEAVGRLLPLLARRAAVSHRRAVGLILAGAVVEGAVFALWPLAAWALAQMLPPVSTSGAAVLVWTPGLAVPLLLAAVLAFPLLGPFLHVVLLAGVGAGLAGALATISGLDWWAAAGCVAVAGVGLGVSVEAVRRLVVGLSTARAPELST